MLAVIKNPVGLYVVPSVGNLEFITPIVAITPPVFELLKVTIEQRVPGARVTGGEGISDVLVSGVAGGYNIFNAVEALNRFRCTDKLVDWFIASINN